MSVVIKTTEMQYRDANGVYHGINAVAEKKIADQEAALDQIVANAQGAVNDLETQSDTFVAAINQMLQTGTDPTLSRPNVAADAASCGDLKSVLIDSRLSNYTFTDGYFVDTTDYEVKSSPSYSYATINVYPYKNLHIRTHAYKTAGICFYDSNGNGIGYIYPTGTDDNYLFDELVTLPENTYTAKITTLYALKSDFSVSTTSLEFYTGLVNAIDDTNNRLSNKVDKNGEKQVTAKNADFLFYSPNLFDESEIDPGHYINQVSGALEESATNYASGWIPVEKSQKYTFSMSEARVLRYFFYDENKTPITGSGALTSEVLTITITAPATAAFCRFSTAGIYVAKVQFEKGETATSYSKYGTAYLLPQYAPQDKIVLNLPKKIYALVGYELNIYFENLVEDWKSYQWDISCTKGMQLERGFRITPTSSDVGTYTLMITATKGNAELTATATLIVTASSAGSGTQKKVIVLGDSTTANGIVIEKLNANFAEDVMSIQTIGTRGTLPNKHEGRAGWSFNDYFTKSEISGVANPFYNPTSQTFDASYYFTNSGVDVPDWFIINLGINDMFSYTTDSALNTAIETVKGLCDDMIASVKTDRPAIKVGLCLTIPPNHSQDAFGKDYYNGQTRDRYKRNNVLWVNKLIAEYDGRESERIYLIPIYTNLDTIYNMGMETNPVNARNAGVTYESPTANGGVHPAESGYWQIADVYTAFLKAQ